jgi:hypothetical protein
MEKDKIDVIVDNEDLKDLISIHKKQTALLERVVKENEMLQDQMADLFVGSIRDRLTNKATILSLLQILSLSGIVDEKTFIKFFEENVLADQGAYEEFGIDIDEILGSDEEEEEEPKPKPKKKSKKSSIIDLSEYKRD